MRKLWVSLCLLLVTALPAITQEIPPAEFRERRRAAMERLPDGILLLHARSSLVNPDQLGSQGFRQDANFFYFTGLGNAASAILALDGASREAWLFVPTKLSGMGELVSNPYVQPGPDSEKRLLIDRVVDWSDFAAYVDGRLSRGMK
ncbi:MAG: aminopeptidase P N-terminal domain-containing protein, partial [Acidobacteriales bacterium]|nr:aminopeptidase P N-terminal domain-containing protein [Terriglobales bacterium]